MVESGFDWDDVGEWPAVSRHYPADEVGNVVRGSAELADASGNIVYSRDEKHLVAPVGVEDLIVSEPKTPPSSAAKIKYKKSKT